MGMSSLDGNTTETVFAFMLVVAFVVLITCTNVSALLLGRAVARRREIGVRLSLGATRLRLVRQLLTESLVYAVLGAATGLVLWALASRIAHLVVPEATRGIPFEVQPVTFAYAAVFAVVTMIAMGIAPALHGTRADIGDVLKSGGQHAVGRSRLQSAFVVAQLACSQPVLVVTSLVLASMSYAAGGGAAPAPADIVTMAALVVRPRPDSAADAASLARIERRLRDVPGVAAVALSMPGGAVGGLRQTNVSTGYYAARRMPLLRGRAPGASEQGLPLAVVNELAARALWPGENPIGKRIERRSPRDGSTLSFEVVGVTRPPDYELETPRPELFVPYAYGLSLGTGELAYSTRITVRTSGDARGYVPQLRSAVREVEPYAALAGIRTVAERLADRVHEARLANLGAFLVAAVALLLASLGLYAIIAYGVAQRTREIGVRLAIGAAPGRVVGEFFRHGVRLSALGLAIGLPLTIGGIRLVMSSVMGLTLRNLVAVGFIVPVLLGVAALASWLPARRAGRVDPLIALQSE
jgi:predicted permease